MYTRFALHVNLKPETPVVVRDVITYQRLNGEHPFFSCERAGTLLYDTHLTGNRLIVDAEFKNYDQEVDKFVDWISPWFSTDNSWVIGYSHYEGSSIPEYFYRDQDDAHLVEFDSFTFAVQHPLKERLEGNLFECGLHLALNQHIECPVDEPGLYRVSWDGTDWNILSKES